MITFQLVMFVIAQVWQSFREQLIRVTSVPGSPSLGAQTRRPSRRLVLVETQHDDGAEPDSDTDSVVYVWEDDHDEDPAQEDDRVEPSHGVAVNRVDHNHDGNLVVAPELGASEVRDPILVQEGRNEPGEGTE